MSVKYMNIREFQDKGYLQELNRLFLHPLGLALEIGVDENNEHYISGVWDYRDDPGGIYFDLQNSSKERIERFKKNAKFIQEEREKRRQSRLVDLGFNIEPVFYN